MINQNIANNDVKTIHEKIEKYEELDSEQRYSTYYSGGKSSEIYLCYLNNFLNKEYLC